MVTIGIIAALFIVTGIILIVTNANKFRSTYVKEPEGTYPKWFTLTRDFSFYGDFSYEKGRILVQRDRHNLWVLATPTKPRGGAHSGYLLNRLIDEDAIEETSMRDKYRIRPHLDNVIKSKLGYETTTRRKNDSGRQAEADRPDISKQASTPEAV